MKVESKTVEASTNALPFAKRMLGEDYGFMFHLLWLIEDDKLVHINSYYKDKNIEGVKFEESNTRLKRVVFANSQLEIDIAIGNYHSLIGKPKHLYIYTNIYDYETIKQYK